MAFAERGAKRAARDAAIAARRSGHLQRVIVVSSSMVYESATVFPTPEGAQLTSPPPVSTYGFQKLAVEYFARAARGIHENSAVLVTVGIAMVKYNGDDPGKLQGNKVSDAAKAAFEKMEKVQYSAVSTGLKELAGCPDCRG